MIEMTVSSLSTYCSVHPKPCNRQGERKKNIKISERTKPTSSIHKSAKYLCAVHLAYREESKDVQKASTENRSDRPPRMPVHRCHLFKAGRRTCESDMNVLDWDTIHRPEANRNARVFVPKPAVTLTAAAHRTDMEEDMRF